MKYLQNWWERNSGTFIIPWKYHYLKFRCNENWIVIPHKLFNNTILDLFKDPVTIFKINLHLKNYKQGVCVALNWFCAWRWRNFTVKHLKLWVGFVKVAGAEFTFPLEQRGLMKFINDYFILNIFVGDILARHLLSYFHTRVSFNTSRVSLWHATFFTKCSDFHNSKLFIC